LPLSATDASVALSQSEPLNARLWGGYETEFLQDEIGVGSICDLLLGLVFSSTTIVSFFLELTLGACKRWRLGCYPFSDRRSCHRRRAASLPMQMALCRYNSTDPTTCRTHKLVADSTREGWWHCIAKLLVCLGERPGEAVRISEALGPCSF
jgi:hypothetical protein